jgi:hypothetical protein
VVAPDQIVHQGVDLRSLNGCLRTALTTQATCTARTAGPARTTRTTRTAGTAGTAGTARPTLAAASLRTTLITQGYQRIHEILLDHFSVIVSI